MPQKIRTFAMRVKGNEGDIHHGEVKEVDKDDETVEKAMNDVRRDRARAVYLVSVNEDGIIVATDKISVHAEHNGAWEDGTRVTPSQVWDAARNYIAREAEAAKQADSF